MPRSKGCSDHAEITDEIGEIGPIKLLNRRSLPSLVCDNPDQPSLSRYSRYARPSVGMMAC
jgi:hypothetical protein